MRADGSEFPVEVVIVTRADLPGPPLFCGYLRDVTEARARERDQRRLMDEQAALRRVATAVAASTDPRRVFGVVTEEVARLLGAQSSNMVRFNPDGDRDGGRRLERAAGPATSRSATRCAMDGDTASARVYRTGAPARVDDYAALDGALARAAAAGSGSVSAVAAPIFLDGRLWGAVIVSSVDPEPSAARRRAADRGLRRARRAGAGQRASRASSSPRRAPASSPAGDAERRRLERNLHDGAQQRLVSLALMLRLAARRHPRRRRPRRARARS